MARIMMFVMITVTMSFMLYLAGITAAPFSYSIINQIVGDNSVITNGFWIKIFAAISVIILGAGAATVFGNASPSISIAAGGLTLLLVSFASDYLSIITYAHTYCLEGAAFCGDWVYWIISLIFIPIIVGYIMALFSFVAGDD